MSHHDLSKYIDLSSTSKVSSLDDLDWPPLTSRSDAKRALVVSSAEDRHRRVVKRKNSCRKLMYNHGFNDEAKSNGQPALFYLFSISTLLLFVQ